MQKTNKEGRHIYPQAVEEEAEYIGPEANKQEEGKCASMLEKAQYGCCTAHMLPPTNDYGMVLPTAGFYFTGDGAYRTSEGYYQLTGRLDDVISISGHQLGTAEVEDIVVRDVGGRQNHPN